MTEQQPGPPEMMTPPMSEELIAKVRNEAIAEIKARCPASDGAWPPILTSDEFEKQCDQDLIEGWAKSGVVYTPPPYPPLPAGVEIVSMENLEMQQTEWIWDGRLARGAITLISGVPQAGKTTCALSFAAIELSGGLWPEGTRAAPGNVLIWTGEDDPARTVKPRLAAMGADPKKVFIVRATRDENGKARPFNPATDLPVLAHAAQLIKGGVDLLIIDPIVSVVGGKVDNGNNAGHREKLQPLVDFAEQMKCAVVGITHFSKERLARIRSNVSPDRSHLGPSRVSSSRRPRTRAATQSGCSS